MAKEVYEILGRPVTKEQYEAASKKMDTPQSEVEKDMDDFAKRARERAEQRKASVKKMKVGGSVKSSSSKMGKVKTAKPSMGGASKRADGIAMRGKTRGRMV